MPNLKPPVTTVAQAAAYRERILAAAADPGLDFQPLMTLYLTDNTPAEEIDRAKASGFVHAVKLLPGRRHHQLRFRRDRRHREMRCRAGAHGGKRPAAAGARRGDRCRCRRLRPRAVFIERVLAPLLRRFPRLRVVLEHITTRRRRSSSKRRAEHRRHGHGAPPADEPQRAAGRRRAPAPLLPAGAQARRRIARRCWKAATSGSPKFFLGTDSAPHAKGTKESACGCAGCYTAHAALELYAEAFESAGALDRLEAFASFHGADFYGLPRNTETITLERANAYAVSTANCELQKFKAPPAKPGTRLGTFQREGEKKLKYVAAPLAPAAPASAATPASPPPAASQ
jgi:dihydroorotase